MVRKGVKRLGTIQTNAALYMRLSKDDELAGESASIENQRSILMKFAEEHGFDIFDEYVDDGWSGTNFDRPSFKRMMADVEDKKINCILVKDLSRFGREHVMFGYYLEFVFPSKGVRFISVNNNFDTAKSDGNERMLVPFMNLMNDMYARDASEKIQAVLHAKMRNGEIITSHEPLGYRKDPENRHTFVIDEETAWIVRRIFSLALEGYGARSISKILSSERIYCPSYWSYLRSGRYAERFSDGQPESNKWKWSINYVFNLLKNEMYIGNTIHLKHGAISYKNQKRVTYDKSRWIVSEGTHPAIISKEDFYRVQELLKIRRREPTGEHPNIFSGLVRCSLCGHTMGVQWRKNKHSDARGYYGCQLAYKYSGLESHAACRISYDKLYTAVLREVQSVCSSVHESREEFILALENGSSEQSSNSRKNAKEAVEKARKRLAELDRMLSVLYEDKLSGSLSDRNFKMLSEKYQSEQRSLEDRIEEFESRLKKLADDADNRQKFADIVETFTNPQELSKDILNALIDKIVVSPSTICDGERIQEVEIVWRFVGVG